MFFVPKSTPKQLLLKLSELNCVESEIALRKFLFLGRLITETKMTHVLRKLFDTRAESFLIPALVRWASHLAYVML